MHHWTRRSILKAAGSGAVTGAGALTAPAATAAGTVNSPAEGSLEDPSDELTLFHNGSVLTMDRACPQASAVLVSGNKIRAVGGTELKTRVGRVARVIDLQGRMVLPGINDSHFHFAQYALTRPPLTVDLSGVTSIVELQARLQQAATARDGQPAEQKSWIKCFGLDVLLLSAAERQSLNRRDLDAVSARHPVSLREASSHITYINSRALSLAGITGGEDPGVVVDAAGEPTGVLNEAAQNLINSVEPPYTAADHYDALPRAFRALHELGLTSYTEPVLGPGMGSGTGLGPDTLRIYEELARSGQLPMRVDVQLAPVAQSGGRAEDFRRYLDEVWKPLQGIDARWLRVGAVKAFADGLDDPLNTGGDTAEERRQELIDIVRVVHERGFQLGIHVIGPQDTGIAVDAVSAAQRAVPRADPRHWLIHGYWIDQAALRRASRAGLGLNMQSSFFVRGELPTLPGRTLLPYRWALNAGVTTMTSSDAPVAAPDWREHLALVVSRRNLDGHQSAPEQQISLLDALHTYTSAPAWQNRAESWKGTITPGKAADLCVLDRNILTVDAERLPEINVNATMLDGRFVYEAF
ncbi:amidohydrolase [Acaricomes phytoseiuli]|uniref:amidohydrolase n=1 Tax=Acaricomes phytoseiuli TaxID=291968 RepID=UPI00222367DD|nr:amidohydrolase [Acaricomes phytoseiuli]MCW1249566.1 amidohydrolase [Acaricomes phytoseiuli]